MIQQELFDRAVSSLYQTVLDAQHWDRAIADVARLFAAPSAAMFGYDFTSGSAFDFRAFGLDPEVGQRYSSYYHRLDPGRPIAMVAGVGEWLADEILLDLRSPQHQEYVQDFALRSDLGWVAGCKVVGDTNRCVYLSLGRPPGDERFGDAARRQYESLAPHLQRVNRMQARLDALTLNNALATSCLDRVQAGVLVVNKSRHVMLINAHGSRLLGRDLSIAHRQLRCSTPAQDEQLRRLVLQACAVPASGGAMRIPRHGGVAPLLLHTLPMPTGHELAGLLPEPLALIVIGDPAVDAPSLDVYRELFGLSAAEAALLAALARGTSVADWAAERGVSVATVRTQLRSLFDKTGTDTQARLLRLVKSVPPIA
jgi:DNA-binding CsgD family transcriptional regulator